MHLKVELRNQPAELERLLHEVRQFLGTDPRLSAVSAKIQIALDEMVGNMIRYGEFKSPVDPFPITVDITVDQDALQLLLVDSASAFDPLRAPTPDTGLSLDERPIGGLGIHLVRQLFDRVEYQRSEGKNRLSLELGLTAAA